MKILKNQIKAIMLILGLTFFTNLYAQKPSINNGMFVRFYNLEGKKSDKGKVVAVTDTTLQLKRMKGIERIDLKTLE